VKPLLVQYSIIAHTVNCNKSNCNQHQSKSYWLVLRAKWKFIL